MSYFLNTSNSNEDISTVLAGPETTAIGQKLGFFNSPTPAPQGESANLADQATAYYQTNILPLQQQALRYATNPNTVTQNVQQAEATVGKQFANLPGAYQQQLSGMGAIASPSQMAAFKKNAAIQQGMATAGAANQTRAATVAAQNMALGV